MLAISCRALICQELALGHAQKDLRALCSVGDVQGTAQVYVQLHRVGSHHAGPASRIVWFPGSRNVHDASWVTQGLTLFQGTQLIYACLRTLLVPSHHATAQRAAVAFTGRFSGAASGLHHGTEAGGRIGAGAGQMAHAHGVPANHPPYLWQRRSSASCAEGFCRKPKICEAAGGSQACAHWHARGGCE